MSKVDELVPPAKEGNIRLPNGCTLYWTITDQGREYISDEVGGGVKVWHTALVDESTLLAAIVQEQTFQKLERVIYEREQRGLRELNKDEIDKFEKFLAEKAKSDQEIYARIYEDGTPLPSID